MCSIVKSVRSKLDNAEFGDKFLMSKVFFCCKQMQLYRISSPVTLPIASDHLGREESDKATALCSAPLYCRSVATQSCQENPSLPQLKSTRASVLEIGVILLH